MKIFRFVDVATLSHRQEETDRFFKVLRGDSGHLREYRRVRTASGVSRSARSHSFRQYRSFGAMVYMQLRAYVKAVTNLRVPEKPIIFLRSIYCRILYYRLCIVIFLSYLYV